MPDRPRITAGPESLPDGAAARLQAIADAHPDAEVEVVGGGYDPACIPIRLTSPHSILSAYSHGAIGRGDAMAMLGLVDELQLLIAMIDVGHAMPPALPAPSDDYPPESIRVLAVLEPLVRDPDDHLMRWVQDFLDDPREPLLPVDSPRVQADLETIMRDCGFSEDMIRKRFPSRPGERVALPVEDLTDAEMAAIMASRPIGPDFSLDDLPNGEARYPAEDGPGSGTRVELTVRVLVGTERSTVTVADPLTGRALAREVLPHGREADVAAAAVEAAIRARLPGDPGGVPGGVREPSGEPGE